LVSAAVIGIGKEKLCAKARELVSVYRTALWVWHRLDEKRWKMSSVSLRIDRKNPRLDVDHTVAWDLWNQKIKSRQLGADEVDKFEKTVNALGNCSLLEKSFNISKSNHSLRFFLEQVHEFKTKKLELTEWSAALGLSMVMIDAEQARLEDIKEAIEERDKAIRDDLEQFVRGTKKRVDLNGSAG